MYLRAGSRMGDVEEAYLRLTLKHTNNNKRRAAQILGVSLGTLHNKLRSYQVRNAKGVAPNQGGLD